MLVERGYASVDSIRQSLAAQQKAILSCPGCGKRYNIAQYDPGKAYRCPACQGVLETPSSLDDVRVDRTATSLDAVPASAAAPPPAPPEPEFPPFGKYRLLRELGHGAMGIVYEATDTALKRKVALKMMVPGNRPDPMEDERFVREGQLYAKLPRHPNIVGVYEAGLLDGRRYLSMELIQGQAMSNWRKTGSVTIRQQVKLLHDVALAVHHAHEHNVIHRDLKPENVLVDAKHRPFVTDFGLAKSLGHDVSMSLTVAGLVVGTPAYMSP